MPCSYIFEPTAIFITPKVLDVTVINAGQQRAFDDTRALVVFLLIDPGLNTQTKYYRASCTFYVKRKGDIF